MTSSKRSSWQFEGESRSWARSGRWTNTVRSTPTSELAPTTGVVTVSLMLELLSRSGGCRDSEEGADDNEDDGQEGPNEAQVLVVTDLREGEAAHDHRGRRRDEIHESRGRLERCDDKRARDTREVGERREDRHDKGRVPGRRRHEEGDRDVDDKGEDG